jgi:hypothetical protein
MSTHWLDAPILTWTRKGKYVQVSHPPGYTVAAVKHPGADMGASVWHFEPWFGSTPLQIPGFAEGAPARALCQEHANAAFEAAHPQLKEAA